MGRNTRPMGMARIGQESGSPGRRRRRPGRYNRYRASISEEACKVTEKLKGIVEDVRRDVARADDSRGLSVDARPEISDEAIVSIAHTIDANDEAIKFLAAV